MRTGDAPGLAMGKARLLRLKRKREAHAEDAIVVEAVNPASALADLSLGPKIDQDASSSGPSKRFRFVRLENVEPQELGSLTRDQLNLMVFAQQQQLASSQSVSASRQTEEDAWYTAVTRDPGASSGPTWASILDLERREGPLSLQPEGQSAKSDDDYVMDIYAALPSDDEEQQGADLAAAWEAHLAGRAPVVQILDDGTWLVQEMPDQYGSSAYDSEDSNAEHYYTHDYPDDYSASTDPEMYDPDSAYFGHTRQHHDSDDEEEGRRSRPPRYDDEEYW